MFVRNHLPVRVSFQLLCYQHSFHIHRHQIPHRIHVYLDLSYNAQYQQSYQANLVYGQLFPPQADSHQRVVIFVCQGFYL